MNCVVQRELASRTEQRSVLMTRKGPTGPPEHAMIRVKLMSLSLSIDILDYS